MSGLAALDGSLFGKFAASITPIYVTFILGLGFCFLDILKLDFTPAISVLIQYVCLPALLFLRIATNDSSKLDIKLLGADALSKLVPLVILIIWWGLFSKLGRVQSLEWVITLWMLATLPNTVLIGDQILTPMFTSNLADDIKNQTTTIIFAQSLYWYNTVILLFEIREMFIEDDLAMNSVQTIEPGANMVRDQSSTTDMLEKPTVLEKSRTSWDGRSPVWENGGSAWEPNRSSLSWEQQRVNADAARPSWEIGRPTWSRAPFDPELNDYSIGSFTPNNMTPMSMYTPGRIMTPGPFMTPGRMTPNYRFTPNRMTPNYRFTPSRTFGLDGEFVRTDISTASAAYAENGQIGSAMSTPNKTLDYDRSGNETPDFDPEKPSVHVMQPIPPVQIPTSRLVRIRKMMGKVLRRMLQVPLLYGSVLGFIWSINKWRVPSFLYVSAELCAEPTVGLAMILIGMVAYKFYKGERGFVPCGQKLLWFGFALRFAFAPIVMYICSLAVNIKGHLLDYAILQVIVPQGSMTFALAQIYGCKLEVITPAIYIQMIVFVPFILAYAGVLGKI